MIRRSTLRPDEQAALDALDVRTWRTASELGVSPDAVHSLFLRGRCERDVRDLHAPGARRARSVMVYRRLPEDRE